MTPLTRRIQVAFIFGSFAGGGESAQSDIDLLIVGSAGLGQASKMLGLAEEKLGREINATVYSGTEFRSKVQKGHQFLNSILKAKKIFLIGDKDDFEGLTTKGLSD